MSVHDDEKKHQKCMDGLEKLFATDAIELKGKQYLQVVDRVNLFRYHYGMAYTIDTEILADDGTRVLMVASIKDNDGRVVGRGYAEEIRNAGPVNRTSAVENCETSAIGRALANIGLAGNEYASAFEMGNIENKEKAKVSQEKVQKEADAEEFDQMQAISKLMMAGLGVPSLKQLRANWAKNKDALEIMKNKYPKMHEELYQGFIKASEKLKAIENGETKNGK